MKDWKLMKRGANGDNYYIMAAALDDEEFTSRLQDGDRLYVVDEGRTLVWFNGETYDDTDSRQEGSSIGTSVPAGASLKFVTIDANNQEAETHKIYLSEVDQQIVQSAWDNKIPSFCVKAVPMTGSSEPEYQILTVAGIGFYNWGSENVPMFDLNSPGNIDSVSSIQRYIQKDETGWYGVYYSD